MLKLNRGNGGIGVWKVENAGEANVRVQEAGGEAAIRILPMNEFVAEMREAFAIDDGLVDQPYQARLTEGMIRCYVSGQRVAGFGHQMVRALAPAEAGPAGRRLYSGPGDARFQDLKAILEHDWIPNVPEFLICCLDELPVIWDADFLLGPKMPPDTTAMSYAKSMRARCSRFLRKRRTRSPRLCVTVSPGPKAAKVRRH